MKHKYTVLGVVIVIGIALWIAFAFIPGKTYPVDLSTSEGLHSTCAELGAVDPDALGRDEERVAYAVCTIVDYMKYATTLPDRYEDAFMEIPQSERMAWINATINKEIDYLLGELSRARETLEEVDLGDRTVLINPGAWAIDFDQDGMVSAVERYIFWIPKPDGSGYRRGGNAEDAAGYYKANFIAPKIKVDQADVYWAIAYSNMGEHLLHVLRAYRLDEERMPRIVLDAPEHISEHAYARALGAIEYSDKLREAVLAETDDDLEWLPNPDQKDTVFPIRTDERMFTTWKESLDHLDGIVRGETLLGGTVVDPDGNTVANLAGPACQEGQGINVRRFFEEPPQTLASPRQLASLCQTADEDTPISGLHKTLSESLARNAGDMDDVMRVGWEMFRYLYWVN